MTGMTAGPSLTGVSSIIGMLAFLERYTWLSLPGMPEIDTCCRVGTYSGVG